MALDVAGLHAEAERAYEWLVDIQRPTARGTTTTCADGTSRTPSSTPTCAPTSRPACGTTGCCTGTAASSSTCGRPSSGPSTGCCRLQTPRRRDHLGASRPTARRGTTRCSPARRRIRHALRCAVRHRPSSSASDRPDWELAAADLADVVRDAARARSSRRSAGRWTGTTRCSPASLTARPRGRLAEGWEHVRDGRLGVRCVSDEPWVTASETAECAHRPRRRRRRRHGDRLLRWTQAHRHDDGAYWTGIVYPERHRASPPASAPRTRRAAVILAADAISRRVAGVGPLPRRGHPRVHRHERLRHRLSSADPASPRARAGQCWRVFVTEQRS